MTIERAICKFIFTILLLFSSHLIFAQQMPVKHFKVKNNTMYIVLSRDLSTASVDSFIQKYNLSDIGLMRFMEKGKDDSLTLMGWDIDRSKSDLFVITKPLEEAKDLIKDDCRIFSPVPTPEDWRVVGGNKIIYGQNDFKDDFSFKREGDIVYFKLKDYLSARRVRLA
ncbi:MAG: hypothetical protein J7497_08785, partial [Chitinophagaceae bacterium]|nr:hypothetical protein [Chitinophagaceae bacterium]